MNERRWALVLLVLISTWSYLPPHGFAATNEDEARWFIGLVNKRNGRNFVSQPVKLPWT